MAKYQLKNKDNKQNVAIHADRKGSIGDTPVTLTYSKITERYNFRIDGNLNLSSSHIACIGRAEDNEVVWEEKD